MAKAIVNSFMFNLSSKNNKSVKAEPLPRLFKNWIIIITIIAFASGVYLFFWNSQRLDIQPSNEKANYQKITLAELQGPTSIKAGNSIEVQGIIIDIKLDGATNSYMVMQDKSGNSALVAGSPEKLTVLNIGDTVLLQGAYADNIKDIFIKKFPLLPGITPFIVAIDIKIISKSSVKSQAQPVQNPQLQPRIQTIIYNWSDFSKINFSDYVKNPPMYLNQQIKLSGMVSDFLAAGDRGGDINYIQIINYQNLLAQDRIMLEINNLEYFRKATSALNKITDLVVIYGIGVASHSFTANVGGKSLIPTIKVYRLDKCNLETGEICADGQNQILFP